VPIHPTIETAASLQFVAIKLKGKKSSSKFYEREQKNGIFIFLISLNDNDGSENKHN
jgi:hypothetical protein